MSLAVIQISCSTPPHVGYSQPQDSPGAMQASGLWVRWFVEFLQTLGTVGIILVGLGASLTFAFFAYVWLMRRYVFVEQGQVMLVNKGGLEPEVVFTKAFIFPLRYRYEMMDISLHTMEIDRKGKDGLICKDNIRADIRVNFFVRVKRDDKAVRDVAQAIGVHRASDPDTLERLFNAKFSEALKTAGKQLDFIELYNRRDFFRQEIIKVIGDDLNGYHLEDVAIDYLEQTPKSSLDPNNILDAQGIKKITELTAVEQILTNEFERNREKEIKQKNVDTIEKVADLERQQSQAELKKRREIETNTARELAEIEKVKSEQQLRSEQARISVEQELAITDQHRVQEIELAKVNTERLIGIEQEKKERDRMLESVNREREVELSRISKERDLEVQRKAIQDVIRERVAVERTVAEEEERIKGVRVLEEARRIKDAAVLGAQGEAERLATLEVKKAEASEMAARLKAKEKLTLAEAELASADKVSQAKIRLAEGIQAEEAALGLAEIRVKEADIVAMEKRGMAEARVKEAQAPADEKLGLARVQIKRADTEADANAIQMKLTGEAAGIAEKAKAMGALNEASRGHEEFRLQVENQRIIAVESLKAQVQMAEHQSRVLAEAFKSAKFNIVGGDGAFMERMLNAASMGRSLDSFMENSETALSLARSPLVKNVVDGSKELTAMAVQTARKVSSSAAGTGSTPS